MKSRRSKNRNSTSITTLLLSTVATLTAFGLTSQMAQAVELRVTDYKKQTFTGFGGAIWWPQFSFTPNAATKSSIYDRLFTDMNLRYLRMNIDENYFASSSNASSTSASSYNIVAYETGGYRDLVDNAKQRNSNIKLMFAPWTPPTYFKDNGSVNGGNFVSGTGNANETAYATQLAMVAKLLKDNYNRQVDYLSVQNEPSYATSYQSAVFTKEQYRRTQEALRQKLTDLGVTGVKLVGPEDAGDTVRSTTTTNYYSHVVNSPSTDVGSAHVYHADLSEALSGKLRRQKPLFMTEWSKDSELDRGAVQAAEVVKRFISDVNQGDATAWIWWALAGNSSDSGAELINAGNTNNPKLTKRYYALKWMSKYIDPDAVVRGTTTDSSDVWSAGFRNSSGKYGAVITNTSTSSQSYNLRFDELSGNRTFDCITIDASNDEASSTVSMSNGTISGSIGAGTVLVLRDQNTASEGSGISISSVSLLSQGQSVVVSAAADSNRPAARAVDGDVDTSWISDYYSSESSQAWIYVDLGGTKTIKEVDVMWATNFGVDYVIQTAADGASNLNTDTPWTTIKSVVGNSKQERWLTYNNLTATGRYVRLKATKRAGGYGHEIKEFQIYGNDGTTPPPTTTPLLGDGIGLTGEYFPNTSFTSPVKTQVDSTIEKTWANAPNDTSGNAISSMPSDNFTVRWTGQMQAVEDGSYTFSVVADDGMKVWLGDTSPSATPIIDQPNYSSLNFVNSNARTLTAGTKYNIKIDFREDVAGAVAKLYWTRPGGTRVIIPSSQLYPTASTAPSVPNGGFETPVTSSHTYNPTGGSWTFSGNSGVQKNNGAFGAATAPEGVQTAFLQGNPNQGPTLGSISQSVNFTSTGSYTLTYKAAQRSGNNQSIKLTVGGTVVETWTPSGSSFTSHTSPPFSIGTPGNTTIKLEATVNTGDNTAFIDDLRLTKN